MNLPELAVGWLVTVQIGLVNLIDATTEAIGGELGTCWAGDQSLTDQTVLEDGWGFDLNVRCISFDSLFLI